LLRSARKKERVTKHYHGVRHQEKYKATRGQRVVSGETCRGPKETYDKLGKIAWEDGKKNGKGQMKIRRGQGAEVRRDRSHPRRLSRVLQNWMMKEHVRERFQEGRWQRGETKKKNLDGWGDSLQKTGRGANDLGGGWSVGARKVGRFHFRNGGARNERWVPFLAIFASQGKRPGRRDNRKPSQKPSVEKKGGARADEATRNDCFTRGCPRTKQSRYGKVHIEVSRKGLRHDSEGSKLRNERKNLEVWKLERPKQREPLGEKISEEGGGQDCWQRGGKKKKGMAALAQFGGGKFQKLTVQTKGGVSKNPKPRGSF